MLDFKKLCDPAWIEEQRLAREREDAQATVRREKLKAMIDNCRQAEESLDVNERSFVRRCAMHMASGLLPSDKEEAWLNRIDQRVRQARDQLDAQRPRG